MYYYYISFSISFLEFYMTLLTPVHYANFISDSNKINLLISETTIADQKYNFTTISVKYGCYG